jgi:hypothetical protein
VSDDAVLQSNLINLLTSGRVTEYDVAEAAHWAVRLGLSEDKLPADVREEAFGERQRDERPADEDCWDDGETWENGKVLIVTSFSNYACRIFRQIIIPLPKCRCLVRRVHLCIGFFKWGSKK